jgi:hypothetical protein
MPMKKRELHVALAAAAEGFCTPRLVDFFSRAQQQLMLTYKITTANLPFCDDNCMTFFAS